MNNINRSSSLEATAHTDGSATVSSPSSVFMKTKDTTESNASTTVSMTPPKLTFSQRWTNGVKIFSNPVLHGIQTITKHSAMNPKITIGIVVFWSCLILVIGLFTNFEIVVDEDLLWTPRSSYPSVHSKWIDNDSGYRKSPRDMTLLFHSNGADKIFTQANVKKIFQTLDSIRSLPDYDKVCARDGTCPISGVTKFWNHSSTLFESNVTSDMDLIEQISVSTYPTDNTPVSVDNIFGHSVRSASTGLLESAQSYILVIDFPYDADNDTILSEDFETKALDVVFALQDQWVNEPFTVEVFAERSFSDEFGRAIVKDIPLVPIVFVIMGIFTCIVFFKRDKVQSRSLFGFMAVVSIFLSIMAGYGLMFVCGVPFTSMTQILPFVFFGVGLDDAFIITGCYFRLDPNRDVLDRLTETMDEIGLSIFITTLTSAIAFALGCTSKIPAVFWLCLYAVPTVILILVFQLSFFIACLVLDERRVQANNRDAFRCISCQKSVTAPVPTEDDEKDSPIDRFMEWFGRKLLLPWVKVIIVLAFVGLAAACSVSTTYLKQEFDFTTVLPGDSYITTFFESYQDYSVRSSVTPYVYFRDVDQSDKDIQNQMDAFITDLVTIDSIISEPEFFWLRDFRSYVQASANTTLDITGETFNYQIDSFLSDPLYYELYNNHIVRDSNGMVTTSRCLMYMDQVDSYDVKDQVKALEDQQNVSTSQPINRGLSRLKFFTYTGDYNIWAFFYQSTKEIRGTTLCSIAAVTFATLMFIPHWSAVIFAFPLICVLYIDFLGFLQWFGVKVNPVSYVTLVMAIGLLVDYLLHILLRFYETPGNRKEKVVEVLRSMGSSVLMGGITTFLGTLPLAFSTSEIFRTVFIAFISLVVLGISHGLILLPVLLSTFGPEDQIHLGSMTLSKPNEKSKTIDDSSLTVKEQSKVMNIDEEDDDEMFA